MKLGSSRGIKVDHSLGPVVAAIDVGTNAVRLEIARQLPDGSLETLHQERDPVRPGEGVFLHGGLPKETADRLLSALRRYSALCRRYGAQVRAVATSALREARNREEIVRRARVEANLKLEVIGGVDEARLICRGVLHGTPARRRSLCVDIGGGSTEVASALGEQPQDLWSIALGAVRLTELFDTAGRVSPKQLKLLRDYCKEALHERLPQRIPRAPRMALGSSGTINAVIGFAAQSGGRATARQITRAVEQLAAMSPTDRRQRFDPRRAEIIVAGAVILESVVDHLGLESVAGVQRGLRDGILVDFFQRPLLPERSASLTDAALAVGERFAFDAAHSKQVCRLALTLFDDLTRLHGLPGAARPLLEVAALLHDVGNSVSYQRHHKHTQYLIQHTEISGLTDKERDLVARVARFHRRSVPEGSHPAMEGLSPVEVRLVRKLATLLRVADSLDRGHRQVIQRMSARALRDAVWVRVRAKGPVDLELWDADHEASLFRQVFRKRMAFHVERVRGANLSVPRPRHYAAASR